MPDLRVVLEHITTREAAEFVSSAPATVAATVTPQHMLLNRNALFVKGLRPHNYCLPVLKREAHRESCMSHHLRPHNYCLPVLKREAHCESCMSHHLRALLLPPRASHA